MSKLSLYDNALKPTGPVAADLGGKGVTGSPAYLKLVALDGTAYYYFAAADGDLRVHTAIPTADSDGAVVGGQS